MLLLAQQIVNGLAVGFGYALLALGFTLIYRTMLVANLAAGETFMIGAVGAALLGELFGLGLAAATVAALVAGALLGGLTELVAFRPFRRFRDEASLRSRILSEGTLLSSFAFGLIVREVVNQALLGRQLPVADSYGLFSAFKVGQLTIAASDVALVLISAALLVAVQATLYRTRVGLAIRAVAENRFGAVHIGVDVDRVAVAVFALAGAVAAVGGLLVSLSVGGASSQMGFEPLLKAFVAMIMGGLTSLPGATVAAILLGLAESLLTAYVSTTAGEIGAYVLLLVTLALFPRGLVPARG